MKIEGFGTICRKPVECHLDLQRAGGCVPQSPDECAEIGVVVAALQEADLIGHTGFPGLEREDNAAIARGVGRQARQKFSVSRVVET